MLLILFLNTKFSIMIDLESLWSIFIYPDDLGLGNKGIRDFLAIGIRALG